MSDLTAVDLFAGMGGSTLGAVQAGIRVLAAANHWQLAVSTHAANHPETEHFTQDLQQANFHDWPDHDLLLASPACQGHSSARGAERPHHDAARSTAWAVVACAEAKRPRFLVIENVTDFTRWQLYPQWASCLRHLGYSLTENILDAADLGVPQHRKRLFIVGTRGNPLVITPGRIPHTAAETILSGGEAATPEQGRQTWSLVNKPGRAEATLRRIENGRRQHGDRFFLAYFGKERGGRSTSRPLGTLTTRDRYALVDGDHLRMLTAREDLAAQGFPAWYRLPPDHKRAVFMIGNSVVPAVMKHVCEHIAAAA